MVTEELSLLELNSLVRNRVQASMPDRYWVRAEVSEVRENYSGHCYLELVDKNERGEMQAKARAVIWANVYRMLRAYFTEETGSAIVPGLKLLVQVSIDLHELYGYTLTIHNIDPRYTLGDMARQRAEIIHRLTQEGIIDMNRELPWPTLPQRIAVISSPTAAGYGDFIDQLHNNPYGYHFYTSLYAAAMQGSRTESSIIEALERIYTHEKEYDCVVIIRGGGATSELNCFDSYPLAQNVAQFPLPVIAGIGHDRDETVIDRVACIRVKTPTAAAEWLIGRMAEADRRRIDLQERLADKINARLSQERQRLIVAGKQLPLLIEHRLTLEQSRLEHIAPALRRNALHSIEKQTQRLTLLEQSITLSSPEHILKRGFSLTVKAGKAVRTADELQPGDRITTFFGEGCSESQIL